MKNSLQICLKFACNLHYIDFRDDWMTTHVIVPGIIQYYDYDS